jgi:glycosyltransferase involved in cell wall biosynthesis
LSQLDAIVVIGPYRGVTGYDRHTREFVRQLHRLGVSLQLVEFPGWSPPMPEVAQDPFFDTLNQSVQAQVTLQFLMPSHARAIKGYRNVNYTMFEADRIPASWVDSAAQQDLIILPNQANLDTWVNSGVPADKLALCSLAIDGRFFQQPVAARVNMDVRGRDLQSFTHRFLNIADLRPRKNHLGLLRSWIRATEPHDDAVLVLKTSANQQNFERFQQDLADMQRSTGLRFEQAAPVVFLISQLTNEQLRALYQTATCYISLSRGEGWDLVMMEAAASGLPVIAPDHSGYSEYIRRDDCLVIPSRREAVEFEGTYCAEDFVFFTGANWWVPDEDQAAGYIRDIVRGNKPESGPGERLVETYTWERAGETLLRVLGEHFA